VVEVLAADVFEHEVAQAGDAGEVLAGGFAAGMGEFVAGATDGAGDLLGDVAGEHAYQAEGGAEDIEPVPGVAGHFFKPRR
jgi:hypothetical protein